MNKSSPSCRFCGSHDAELLGREVAGAPESEIFQCRSCSLVYLFPIMSEAEEQAFYRREFEHYMQGRSGASWKSPEAHFRSYQAEGERRMPLVQPYLRVQDDFLEIGSSTGYFLDDVRTQVASVTGVEPSELYREFANGHGIKTYPDMGSLKGRKFDVIALYYVVEHLRDPVDYMKDLRPWLKPGGRVLIEVPNVDDALLRTYSIPKFGPFYWQKAHYHYFSQATLAAVLTRAGYESQMIPVQRYDLSNHMVWMMEGKPGGVGRYRQLFSAALEAAYADSLRAHWVCDTVFAVATAS
jgi:SAM-dependent methyltransferase